MRVLQILSGGMDSATLAHWHKARGDDVEFLSFNYGQRHVKELNAAVKIAQGLGCRWDCIGLQGLADLLPGSSLTDSAVATPQGHYAADNMKLTVVPSRNAIMLSAAFGIAVAREMDAISFGAHAGDHTIYPDCRREFVSALEEALNLGVWSDGIVRILSPFLDLSKTDILRIGLNLGVPYEDTWTCYQGGEAPCGVCGACQERAEAFRDAGAKDPLLSKGVAA